MTDHPISRPVSLSGVWFRLRLTLGDGLYVLAAWVMPEHHYNSVYSDDGETITIWREPVCRT